MRSPLVNTSVKHPDGGICLNMIVKNEKAVIERLLRSVSPYIDSYLIVDTGSTDDTPEIIHNFMIQQNISGEVHFRDWVNFGHNRQQALDLAVSECKPQWLLIIDADEELRCSDNSWHKKLTPGTSYQIEKHWAEIRFPTMNLIWADGLQWFWRGVVHESLHTVPDNQSGVVISDVWIHAYLGEGARSLGISQKDKFLKDAELLEASLKDDPLDPRSRFYLAQSYRDAGELNLAFENYSFRADMLGWPEETYMAQYEKAVLCIRLGMDSEVIVSEFMEAFSMRATRAEPLWQLARYFRENNRFAQGYIYAKAGKDMPRPTDLLFVQSDVYEWRLLDEFSICAYYIGQYSESLRASALILTEREYAKDETERLIKNHSFALVATHPD